MVEPRRIGLIVNPIAGIGGPLAMRGSDHLAGLEAAFRHGGHPSRRNGAQRALARLRQIAGDVPILAASGPWAPMPPREPGSGRASSRKRASERRGTTPGTRSKP